MGLLSISLSVIIVKLSIFGIGEHSSNLPKITPIVSVFMVLLDHFKNIYLFWANNPTLNAGSDELIEAVLFPMANFLDSYTGYFDYEGWVDTETISRGTCILFVAFIFLFLTFVSIAVLGFAREKK